MIPSSHSCVSRVPSLRASTPRWDIGCLYGTFPKGSRVSSSAGPPDPSLSQLGALGPASTARPMAHGRCSVCVSICMHTRVLCLASVFSLPNTPSQPVAIPCALTLGMPHAQGWLPSVHLSVHPGTASSAEPPYAHPQSSVNVYTGILESRAGLTPGEGFLVPRWALGAAKTSILLRAKIGAAAERGGFGAYNVSVEAQCWGGRAPLWTLGIRYEAPSPPAWLWHREGESLVTPVLQNFPLLLAAPWYDVGTIWPQDGLGRGTAGGPLPLLSPLGLTTTLKVLSGRC